MPYKKISLSSPTYGIIPMTVTAVDSDTNMVELETHQPFGSVHWKISDYKKFRLWHAVYKIHEPVSLTITEPDQYLGVLLALQNNFQYLLKGLSPMTLLEHQHDLFYAPDLQLDYRFDSQTYVACGFNFKTSFFNSWGKLFSSLDQFMSHLQAGQPARLSDNPMGTSPTVLASLYDMLRCTHTGALRRKYIRVKTADFTFELLQNTTAPHKELRRINQSDIVLIQGVKDHLLNKMTNPGTIQELSLQFGMNDFKLKKVFRQVFGTPIHAFLLKERMQKAFRLIGKTDASIAHIAQELGYKDTSAFSVAFKKYFGYSPSVLRKGGP